MADPRRADGFTLVELLIVLGIIGLLAGLVVPAVQSARESSRRAACANNLRNTALGLVHHAQLKQSFPGYSIRIRKTVPSPADYRASWVVDVLPHLERGDLYENWKNPSYPLHPVKPSVPKFPDASSPANLQARRSYFAPIATLICPSTTIAELGDNPLSFVLNTGSAVTASDNFKSLSWREDENSGVAFNQSRLDNSVWNNQPVKKVGLDFVAAHDGISRTLLLSENLQAGSWATDPILFSGTALLSSDFAVRQNVGFAWFLTGNPSNQGAPAAGNVPLSGPSNANYRADAMCINGGRQSVSGAPRQAYDALSPAPTGLAYARPSSNHPGGVNAAFCDDHVRFLDERVAYQVYTQLMTPHDKEVIVDYVSAKPYRASYSKSGGATVTPGPNKVPVPWTYVLNEVDY